MSQKTMANERAGNEGNGYIHEEQYTAITTTTQHRGGFRGGFRFGLTSEVCVPPARVASVGVCAHWHRTRATGAAILSLGRGPKSWASTRGQTACCLVSRLGKVRAIGGRLCLFGLFAVQLLQRLQLVDECLVLVLEHCNAVLKALDILLLFPPALLGGFPVLE